MLFYLRQEQYCLFWLLWSYNQKILQNAFSHTTCICLQKPYQAEKLEAKEARFSRQCALQVFLANFMLKAFRNRNGFAKDCLQYSRQPTLM